MGYRVKKCANCNTINDVDSVLCSACECMLPSQIITHDFPPPSPPRSTPPAVVKVLAQRDWRYGEVPVEVQSSVPLQVTITGLDIGFIDLVRLMIQLLLAAIPAIIIATIIVVVILAALGIAFTPR